MTEQTRITIAMASSIEQRCIYIGEKARKGKKNKKIYNKIVHRFFAICDKARIPRKTACISREMMALYAHKLRVYAAKQP